MSKSQDDWVHVGRRKGARVQPIKATNPVARDATAEKLVTDFEAKMQTWRKSSCQKQCSLLLNRQQPDEGWNITKAVLLASGSFSRDNWDCQRRSMWQLVACVDLIRSLQMAGSCPIQIFAQDPNYTEIDKEFLSTLDITLLDITWTAAETQDLGLAKAHLGIGSIVFELFMDMGNDSMEALITGTAKIYVASSLQSRLSKRPTEAASSTKSSNVKRKTETNSAQPDTFNNFQQEYRSYRFPRFEEDPLSFEGLFFHWNEPKEDDDQD